MDHCLIADPLPHFLRVPPYSVARFDFRLFVRFEAAMLRVKDDQEAGPIITQTLDEFMGAGWQAECPVQNAFDELLWFYRGGQAAPNP